MSVTVFVPDIPEFMPLVRAAERVGDCQVRPPLEGYWRIDGERELRFVRKELALTPALWNSALSGGFYGQIVEYGRDIVSEG